MSNGRVGVSATETLVFELVLPGFTLESGARLDFRRARGWASGPIGTAAWIEAAGGVVLSRDGEIAEAEALVAGRPRPVRAATQAHPTSPPAPIVVLVHALTGDMRAGGPGGWWAPVIGPEQPLDPHQQIIVCFNNLGGCYGSTGPADEGFPCRADEAFGPPPPPRLGAFELSSALPATITPWDQAQTHIDSLDALGVREVELLAGGSVGGMQVLCMAVLAPARFLRVVPIAASCTATASMLAWNHIGRQLVVSDMDFPRAGRGLELARQLAHATYRAPAGLEARQGRRMIGTDAGCWSPQAPYAMQTYLEHQGAKLRSRYDARAYLCALDAMDHHDIARRPHWCGATSPWGLSRISGAVLSVVIDSDQLFLPDEGRAIAATLRAADRPASDFTIQSLHGHDAFLIEWQQVRDALHRAMALPAPPRP